MYFIPDKLPISGLDWQALAPLIGRANAKLSNYNGILHNMVNPKILLSPLTKQEAVLSSKIEGTRASLSDIYQKDLGEKYDQEKENDIEEINNYRNALAFATEDLTKRPICLNMLRDIHFRLLAGVRGHNKKRGEFRTTDVFIGAAGDTIENAKYVPPQYVDMLPALDNFEKYMHKEDEEILVQLAILHAQFEIIHPFNDGNGRMSRLLTLLLLYQNDYIVGKYISLEKLIERTKDNYYEALQESSQGWMEDENNYEPFAKYILGIITAAYREFFDRAQIVEERKVSKPDRIEELIKNHLGTITKAEIVDATPGISTTTVQRTLTELVKAEKIIKIGNGRYTKYKWNWDKEI